MPQKHIRFDWAIKRLLRQKSNFGILDGFLSELLNFDVKIQKILESESNKIDEHDKYNRVDILAKDNHGQLILIEVQNEKQHDYFHRMNYGQAKLITEHISAGDTYDQVKKVYSVNIVYFELGQGMDYIYIGKNEFRGFHCQDILQLSEKQRQIYPAKEVADIFTTYYILKINNFDNNSRSTIDEWIYFLKNNEIKDEFRAKGLQEAKEKLRVDNLSGIEKEEYDLYLKDQRNKTSEVKTAFIDGQLEAKKELMPVIEEERKQKEKAQKQKEDAENKLKAIVLSQLKKGKSPAEISDELGLTDREIKKIIEGAK